MVDWKQFIKYAIVGGSGVVVNTAVLYILTEYAGLFLLWSGIIAAELSIINNFILNEKWTFKAGQRKDSVWSRFLTFQGVSILGTVILLSVMMGLTTWFNVYYVYANWVGVATTFIINYILNKYITWSDNGK